MPSTRSLRPKSPPLPAVLKEIKPPPTPSPRSSNAVKKTESSRVLNSERASTSRAHPPPVTAVKTNNTTKNISKIVPTVKASPSISKPSFLQTARSSKPTVLSLPNLKSSKSLPAKKPVRSKSPVITSVRKRTSQQIVVEEDDDEDDDEEEDIVSTPKPEKAKRSKVVEIKELNEVEVKAKASMSDSHVSLKPLQRTDSPDADVLVSTKAAQ
ncbi:hypothetical protein AB205_0041770, partial [Aquarana catesbeiana]